MWLVSGIVMILLPGLSDPGTAPGAVYIDFREIELSPAQAVEKLEKAHGSTVDVSQLNLRRIQDIIVYEVHLEDSGSYLLNAVSGQIFAITPEMAERYVLAMYPTGGRVLKVESVQRHDYSYQWGLLPAYRVVLDADPSVDFFVALNDGTVRRSDTWNRLMDALASLHTLEPLKLFTRRDEVRKGLVIIAGVIGIVATITGYYLALRRNRARI